MPNERCLVESLLIVAELSAAFDADSVSLRQFEVTRPPQISPMLVPNNNALRRHPGREQSFHHGRGDLWPRAAVRPRRRIHFDPYGILCADQGPPCRDDI